ncbi:hypothetical protein LTR08_001144 [Meristemomyces frigidus]|nr:hypothetical protein LTR08_001144 [Meristemomyces frigidus]
MANRQRALNVGNPIPEPEEAHVRHNQDRDDSEDEREATELHAVDEQQPGSRRMLRIVSPRKLQSHWYDPVKKLWMHHIRISVPHVDCRDHLANERTYLGYLRTSVALSIIGITVAQLYRLQHVAQPNSVFGYFVLSKPIAAIFQLSALGMSVLGAIRFYRQQSAMAVGKVHSGGWEILFISVYMFGLLLAMFAVHVGIDVYKEM